MKMRPLAALVFFVATLISLSSVNAMPSDIFSPIFSATHGAQGTGNYKGKRDRHEKAGPGNEKKKKKLGWLPLRK